MIDKERALRENLSALGAVVVAYSGGVDSAFLAWIAHETLGQHALAVTADSPSYPERHRDMAQQVASRFGLHHAGFAPVEQRQFKTDFVAALQRFLIGVVADDAKLQHVDDPRAAGKPQILCERLGLQLRRLQIEARVHRLLLDRWQGG